MATLGSIIAASASLTPIYAERLLAGIQAADFARFARPGGVSVVSNHPAFVLGHLAIYPARVMERLGRPVGDAAAPPGFEELFKAGAECRDDPQGSIYPSMQTITDAFFKGYRVATAAIAEAADAQLAGSNPAEGRLRELFPTLGAMMGFYICGHPQMHLGQMSVWRRMMGMPAAA